MPLRSSLGSGSYKGYIDGNSEKKNKKRNNNKRTPDVDLCESTYSVSLLFGNFDNLRESFSGFLPCDGKVVEDVGQGSGEDSLDFNNLVTGLNEVGQGGDDGETGTSRSNPMFAVIS
jgi:hypothetical protein